jgi:hypothetical protein
MKKIIIAAALIFTTGILASCSKINGKQLVLKSVQVIGNEKKDLATAD